jgi:hypothetical protein
MTTTLPTRSSTNDQAAAAGLRATLVAAGPVLLAAALLWHPPLPGRLPDSAGVADAAAADVARWGLSHVAAALASAAVAVAFLVVRGYLRERGDRSASAVGLGLVVVGSTLYAMLPGMEFAVVAADATGADLAATQASLESWFVAVLVLAAATFACGTALVAVAVVRTATLGRATTVLVASALVVLGLSRIVPVGVVQFQVQALAGLVALLPLAVAIGSTRRAAGPR